MPLEQLLALYGYQIPQGGVPGGERDVSSPREVGLAEQVVLGDPIKEEEEETLCKQGVLCGPPLTTTLCSLHQLVSWSA